MSDTVSRVSIDEVAKAIGAPKLAITAASTWAANITRWAQMYACQRAEFNLALSGIDFNRQRRTLAMEKRICEDWAGLVWTENAVVTAGTDAEAAFLEALFGSRFAPLFCNHLEQNTFALGGGGLEVLVDGIGVTSAGAIVPVENTSIGIGMAPAQCVIALSWNQERVTEAAFVSFGDEHVDVRIHSDVPGGRMLRNMRLSANGLTAMELPEGIVPEMTFMGAPRLFSCLSPAIANNIDPTSPYGLSVFANARDALETVDLIWDNFGEDFELGGKVVFVPDTMLKKVDGKFIPPQKSKANLFVPMIDPSGGGIAGSGPGITEHNPDLRVESNTSAIEAALGLLSAQVGMGAERYRYREGNVMTATQVVSENSDLFRSRRKHLLAITSSLTDIAEAALWCGRNLANLPLDPAAEIVVRSDDSVIEDDGSRIARGLQLFQANAISQLRFLTDYLKLSEDDAAAEVALSATAAAPLF